MDDIEIQVMLAEYEFARDNRISADTTAWEMTSIVWGAQTLLLGFVLEALPNKESQELIIFVGGLGILLCIFNHFIMKTRSKVAREMVIICRQ
jgi:hypothetical protein